MIKEIWEQHEYIGMDRWPIPIEVVGADGHYLKLKGGKKVLDFVMGWNVGNVGWNNKYVDKRMKRFKGPCYVLPQFVYKPWTELAKKLAEITPGNLKKSFRATGGTEAVEIALQMARIHTHRKKFLSFETSCHGHSIGCMSVGGSSFKEQFSPLLFGCDKITPGNWELEAKRAKKMLSTGQYAAFISEPIICNYKCTVPPKFFFEEIKDACRDSGTLLIMDEVATGFGRTGKMFGCEHYKIKPDIMTMAKGITSGHAGLGATIATKKVAKAMEFEFSTYSTFGWMPLAVEAALANIEYIEKKNLVKNAEKMGNYFFEKLEDLPVPSQGKGLAIALLKEHPWKTILECYAHGLLISPLTGRIGIFPPLDVTKKEIDKAYSILKKSI